MLWNAGGWSQRVHIPGMGGVMKFIVSGEEAGLLLG